MQSNTYLGLHLLVLLQRLEVLVDHLHPEPDLPLGQELGGRPLEQVVLHPERVEQLVPLLLGRLHDADGGTGFLLGGGVGGGGGFGVGLVGDLIAWNGSLFKRYLSWIFLSYLMGKSQ